MTDHDPPYDGGQAQVARLRQFIDWMFVIVFAFACVYTAASVLFSKLPAAVTALTMISYLGLLLLSRAQLRHAHVNLAMAITCVGLLVAALLIVFVQPYLYPVLVIIPLVAVGAALPFVTGRSLWIMLAICWLAMVGVALIGEFVPALDSLPRWRNMGVRVTGIAAAAALALLLLWQFSQRLNDALEQSQSTYRLLSESEEHYRLLAEHSSDLIGMLDLQGNVLYASPSYLRVLGYTTVELALMNIVTLVHPDDRTQLLIAIDDLLAFQTSQTIALQLGQKAGGWIPVEAVLSMIADGADAEPRLLLSVRDITIRTRAEESLRESRALLQLVADGVPVLIAYVDAEQRYRFVNRGFLEWFGLSELETIGREMRELLGEQLFTAIERYVDAALAGEQVIFEAAPLDRAGMAHDMRVVYIPDKGQDGEIPGFVIMVQDITERRRAEEQRLALERKMLETQRLESIGMLAGGIAHDFNNLLTAILGNAGLALLELPPKSEAHDTVERIVRAAEQAADLTRQMLAYSGRGQFLIQPLDLNAIIAESRSLIDTSIGAEIELRYDLAHTLPTVEADAAQIRQMLLNLVLNAAEAIDDQGGVIKLHTTAVSAAEASLAQLDLAPERIAEEFVLLRVSDTGAGMDAETRTRMFDPFFSTKFTGRGLGLAAVLGIVRGHHGGLYVQSEPGHGTIVTVLLPSMRQTPSRAEDPPARAQPTRSPVAASNTVLVVDDDPAVRAVATRMLERLGCMVLQAADGQAAIDLFQINHETIALILLDLIMPQLSAERVLSELQRINPRARVVVMSGYTQHEATQLFSSLTPTSFLQKPFTSDELRSAVQSVITLRDG